ncbi:hypothetical protein LUZ60_005115 [Juncus effusus]|nr:hypothetical protein LUZ60_005115 [Juncus effusus]
MASLTILFFSLLHFLPLHHRQLGHIHRHEQMFVHSLGSRISWWGKQLASGQNWDVNIPAGTKGGHVWGRTGCNFDSNGNGKWQTGDCGKLAGTGYGSPPNTLAEFSLNENQGLDTIDMSLVDGFNIPMDFLAVNRCTESIHCAVDINAKCPSELKTTGGCLNPCQVYKTDEVLL